MTGRISLVPVSSGEPSAASEQLQSSGFGFDGALEAGR